MFHINQIRMVSTHHLFTGMADHTWFFSAFFTKQSHGQCISKRFSADSGFTGKDVCMRNDEDECRQSSGLGNEEIFEIFEEEEGKENVID